MTSKIRQKPANPVKTNKAENHVSACFAAAYGLQWLSSVRSALILRTNKTETESLTSRSGVEFELSSI